MGLMSMGLMSREVLSRGVCPEGFMFWIHVEYVVVIYALIYAFSEMLFQVGHNMTTTNINFLVLFY